MGWLCRGRQEGLMEGKEWVGQVKLKEEERLGCRKVGYWTGLGERGGVRCIEYQVQTKQILQRADRPVLPDVWVSLWPRKPRQPFVPDNISSEFEFYTCQCFMSLKPAVREGAEGGKGLRWCVGR